MQAVGMMDLGQGSTDPVELRRLNFQTPGKLLYLSYKNYDFFIFIQKIWNLF